MLCIASEPAATAPRHAALGVVIAIGVLASGCSADVTRFDFPAFGLTENKRPTGSVSPSSDSSARRNGGYDDAATVPSRGAGLGEAPPPPYGGGAGDRYATARDTGPPSASDLGPAGNDRYAGRATDRASAPAERRVERPRPVARGETIQVQQGDTLYGIARRHGVSIAALIEVNNLTNGSTIKPGQSLVLPAGAQPARAAAEPTPDRMPERHPVARGSSPPASAVTPAAQSAPAAVPVAGWEGRHTMKAGESLYGVARQYGVTLSELQRVNGITEPTRVRTGTVVSVPGRGEAAGERHAQPASRVTTSNPGTAPSQPRIINGAGERTAALGDRASDARPSAEETAPPAASATGRFRWPARGRMIAGFGKRPDGTHNDGINIAVPQGTEIHAAEGGRVAYAGSELKGYGNLVLIRHDNGWVSAYAHADQILVKRDDVIRRGQVIARAGKTGTVDQPQLHFELRQGAKPVDPLPHMEK